MMDNYKIVSKAKTMKEAGEVIVRFSAYDRDWKGCSVVASIDDGKYGSIDSLVVKEELYKGCTVNLYLCIGHFKTKATAHKMVEDLQSGKITLAQALEKSLKSYERWVAKVVAGKGAGGSSGIARNQLIYFGGTKEQVARLDAANKAFSERVRAESKYKSVS